MRLIPAYAGRTLHLLSRIRVWWAHPRLRGADFKPENEEEWHEGSSPLTRGGLVGTTWCSEHVSAHPRLRGADLAPKCHVDEAWGSSPLTRGGQPKVTLLAHTMRLIPAYAGRTPEGWRSPRPPWAHPRLRGADGGFTIGAPAGPGSSPLTRGGLLLRILNPHRARLIPAYAGRTTQSHTIGPHDEAHPRLRGADA